MVDNAVVDAMYAEATATATDSVAALKALFGENLFVTDGTNVGLNVDAFGGLADSVHVSFMVAAASGDRSYVNEVAGKLVFVLNAIAAEGDKAKELANV